MRKPLFRLPFHAILIFHHRWPNGVYNNIAQYYSSKLSWYYTWSPWDVPGADLEFVPMFWGVKQVSDFQSQVTSSAITSNSAYQPL